MSAKITEISNNFQQEAKTVLEIEKTFFSRDINEVSSDLIFLAEQAQLQSYMPQNKDSSAVNEIANTFLRFSQNKERYDQIRYIDVNGVEIIRINYKNGSADIIPTTDLQNKLHRYYFSETTMLKSGEVYISPFDLNIENKQIEVPLKPMIRFGTPIKDYHGNNNGIIIVNYFGQLILDKFLEIRKGFSGNIMLLNAEGYYLIGQNRDQDWAFMFNDKMYGHFSTDFPAIWPLLKDKNTGFKQSLNGLFMHQYIEPELFWKNSHQGTQQLSKQLSKQRRKCKNCRFIMVAYLSHKQIEQIKSNYLNQILPSVIFITLLLIFTLWLILKYYNKHQQSEQKLFAIHSSLLEERDAFVGGPTIVFKWFNHYGWPVEYVSENVNNVLGYQAEQFMQQELNFSSIIIPEHRQQVIDNLNKAKKQEKNWLELDAFQIVAHNGERLWVQGTVTFLKDEDGYISRFFGYFNDISRLKEIEEQLIQNSEYIQSVINTIADPTLVINVADYNIQFSNRAANKMYLDTEKYDAKSMTCYQLSHKINQPCSGGDDPCPILEVKKTGKTARVVHTHFNQQKQKLYIEVAATPIFDEYNQISQIIESHRDISSHIEKQQKLQELAVTDPLTKIYNRLKFDNELENQINQARLSKITFSLIMLDIDHFKHINDEFGHDIGDEILKKFVIVIRNNIRSNDILARWGGEEFMLLMPLCNIQTAQRICDQLQQAVACYDFEIGRPVTSSFGVTSSSDSDTSASISKRVDDALYQSKLNGRNCVTVRK
ncbi:MAG: diguanylate cyclase [gamma proteobacterium symbiont of Taylorina sp.]|nr:diguanylate cyclase [gamma proteobacterium symbiont of Taylorina sp.]